MTVTRVTGLHLLICMCACAHTCVLLMHPGACVSTCTYINVVRVQIKRQQQDQLKLIKENPLKMMELLKGLAVSIACIEHCAIQYDLYRYEYV